MIGALQKQKKGGGTLVKIINLQRHLIVIEGLYASSS